MIILCVRKDGSWSTIKHPSLHIYNHAFYFRHSFPSTMRKLYANVSCRKIRTCHKRSLSTTGSSFGSFPTEAFVLLLFFSRWKKSQTIGISVIKSFDRKQFFSVLDWRYIDLSNSNLLDTDKSCDKNIPGKLKF